MKEAAGEANLTVIAIILIGVIAAVVTPIINSTMKTRQRRSCCYNAGGTWDGSCSVNNADYTSCVNDNGKTQKTN